MSKKTSKTRAKTIAKSKNSPFKNIQLILGIFLIIISISLFLSFSSFLYNWKVDQSQLDFFWNKDIKVNNLFGKVGANIGHLFIYKLFGISSYILSYLILKGGLIISFRFKSSVFVKQIFKKILLIIWLSIFFSLLFSDNPILGGVFGFEVNDITKSYIGNTGVVILLSFSMLIRIIIRYNLTPHRLSDLSKYVADFLSEIIFRKKAQKKENKTEENNNLDYTENTIKPTQIKEIPITELDNLEVFSDLIENKIPKEKPIDDVSELEIEIPEEEERQEEKIEHDSLEDISESLVNKHGEYNPELDLALFKKPELSHLIEHSNGNISINREELEQNKNNIVNTLNNYKIEISKIKATIGPTVTLYEIIPAPGVRISKIKNLEDDIALSLSALGIRIIAPIPGKGTIGIEVPNKDATVVSMKSVLSSSAFQNSKMDLPIALGKTISNTTFVADLAKMPHLLVAGATGQGKSVGLNAIMTSLLYKKHPSELKFVLVDPKKVELTLFNKIERHYLAKTPDSESAIITDTAKVINTLNSLCIEMDDRYELLKEAMVRNIREYNTKFKLRKLNPEKGHKFLPYIVLIIDEFADLIMTAGKEVETPIARLAQLARAIGIHLIVATQRPSVNVITGVIKANFPARIAFRVSSKIDSRTILDEGGANQLIGKGDMLFSNGNETIRLQCAFVDTPEIESITDYIGEQKGYSEAYILPEFVGDDNNSNSSNINIDDRDPKFEEAARLIVIAQQGSASLLQRKLKLGYNRAGRIVDQLEDAGIIGPFEGSKARQVLVTDEVSLQELLKNEKNNS